MPDYRAAPHEITTHEAQAKAKNANKRKAIIAAVVAVVIVCAGVGIGVWWKTDQDAKKAAEKAAWERAHAMLTTNITSLNASGFDENATAIPVQVTGVDLDGNEVDELQFMRPTALQVQTKQGSYNLLFPGGFFTGDGQAVKAPEVTIHVEPSLDEAEAARLSVAPDSSSSEIAATSSQSVDEPIAYTPIDALDVTDEDIDEIAKWAAQDPEDAGKASRLKDAVVVKRDEAIAEKKRQEEEAAERARVEARKAQIVQTAEDFLYYLYDNEGSRGKQVKDERSSVKETMFGFTNRNGSLQSGWPYTWMVSMNRIEAIDENTVSYELNYERDDPSPGTTKYPAHDSGTIAFGENGRIDQWYPEGSPNGRLVLVG